MQKLQLLFKMNDPKDLLPLTRQLYAQSSWVETHNSGTVRLAVRNDRARQVLAASDVPEIDMALEFGLPDDASTSLLIEHATSLIPQFTDLVDPTRSIAIVGPELELVTGEGPYQLFRSFGRKKGISLQQFRDHLLNIHSQFGIGLGGRPAYRQLHRDEAATEILRSATGFTTEEIDGISQLLFHGPGAFEEMGGTPERAAAASADGGLFIDPDTRRTSVAEVILRAGPIS